MEPTKTLGLASCSNGLIHISPLTIRQHTTLTFVTCSYLDHERINDADVLDVAVLLELLAELGTTLLHRLGDVIVHHCNVSHSYFSD